MADVLVPEAGRVATHPSVPYAGKPAQVMKTYTPQEIEEILAENRKMKKEVDSRKRKRSKTSKKKKSRKISISSSSSSDSSSSDGESDASILSMNTIDGQSLEPTKISKSSKEGSVTAITAVRNVQEIAGAAKLGPAKGQPIRKQETKPDAKLKEKKIRVVEGDKAGKEREKMMRAQKREAEMREKREKRQKEELERKLKKEEASKEMAARQAALEEERKKKALASAKAAEERAAKKQADVKAAEERIALAKRAAAEKAKAKTPPPQPNETLALPATPGKSIQYQVPGSSTPMQPVVLMNRLTPQQLEAVEGITDLLPLHLEEKMLDQQPEQKTLEHQPEEKVLDQQPEEKMLDQQPEVKMENDKVSSLIYIPEELKMYISLLPKLIQKVAPELLPENFGKFNDEVSDHTQRAVSDRSRSPRSTYYRSNSPPRRTEVRKTRWESVREEQLRHQLCETRRALIQEKELRKKAEETLKQHLGDNSAGAGSSKALLPTPNIRERLGSPRNERSSVEFEHEVLKAEKRCKEILHGNSQSPGTRPSPAHRTYRGSTRRYGRQMQHHTGRYGSNRPYDPQFPRYDQ